MSQRTDPNNNKERKERKNKKEKLDLLILDPVKLGRGLDSGLDDGRKGLLLPLAHMVLLIVFFPS